MRRLEEHGEAGEVSKQDNDINQSPGDLNLGNFTLAGLVLRHVEEVSSDLGLPMIEQVPALGSESCLAVDKVRQIHIPFIDLIDVYIKPKLIKHRGWVQEEVMTTEVVGHLGNRRHKEANMTVG